jgi:hypothetical protein
VHACPQQIRSAKHAPSPENDSNRGQRENQIYSNKSLGYVWSVGKRWDTSDRKSQKIVERSIKIPNTEQVDTYEALKI